MVERVQLAKDLEVCRIINGMWQVAGGHGQMNPDAAISEMFQYHNSGLTTWDMADIYGPAEAYLGHFRKKLAEQKGKGETSRMQALTKFVPSPSPMSRSIVEHHIDNSRRRMGVESIDLLQFHWWDYNDIRYIDAMHHLTKLRDEGKIRHIGLTNFDTERMEIMTEQGFEIVSNQVQYSILDQRPASKMESFCKKHGISLLAYGTILGGFFSKKYLGKKEPTREDLHTLSLQKYKHMIDVWGGWNLFQDLLRALEGISEKHKSSIANVAARFVLDRPQVASAIIGARLGISNNITDNLQVFSLNLDSDDLAAINSVTSRSNDLFDVIGDCGDEYR